MNTAMRVFAVGESDFKKIITGNFYYVDKSLLIKEIIDQGDLIILLHRPRRFGKTLNISMLKYFYDCCPEPCLLSPLHHFPRGMGYGTGLFSSFINVSESK